MSRAQHYPRLILALVCLPVFIGALDLTIVSAVLPDVIRSMTIEIQKLDIAGWVVTGYFVSYAVSMTFMGRVSDISGRRAAYLVCLVIFFVGSWLVAASPGWPAQATSRILEMFAVTWWSLAGLRAGAKGGIDWIGVTLLGIALVLINVGLGSPEIASEISTNPPQHRAYWIGASVIVFVIFLLSQRRIREPILN